MNSRNLFLGKLTYQDASFEANVKVEWMEYRALLVSQRRQRVEGTRAWVAMDAVARERVW